MGFFKGFRKQVRTMAKKVTHAAINPTAELVGGITGSRSTQERMKGTADALVGAGLYTVSAGSMGKEQMKEGGAAVMTGGATAGRSEEEIKIFSIPELELTDEQRRVRAAVEAREKQKTGGRGRSASILTGQKQSTQADSILTTKKGTSILGR